MGILQKYRSNIVADFDYRKGLKADQSGLSGVPAITGSPAFTNSSEGRGIAFPNPDIASYITQAWASSNLTTNGTFYAIFVHNDPTNASVQGLLASGRVSNYNWVTRVSGGNCSLRLHDTTFTDTQDLISGKTYIAIWTVDATTLATTAVKSWVNGNRGLSTTGNLTKNLDGSLGDFIEIGRYAAGGSAAMFNGIIFKCGALNITLTEPEAAELTKDLMDEAYVTKAFTERLKKTNGTSYATYIADGSGWNETLANVTAGDLSNTGFQVFNGTHKVEQATGLKKKIVSAGDGLITKTSNIAYGSWEAKLTKQAGENISYYIINDRATYTDSNGYYIFTDSLKRVSLIKRTAGSNTNIMRTGDDVISDGVEFTVKVTRDAATNTFSMYINDVLVDVDVGTNPVIDSDHTISTHMMFYLYDTTSIRSIANIEEGY